MKKKILTLTLIATTLFTLAGCSKNDSKDPEPVSTQAQAYEIDAYENEADETEAYEMDAYEKDADETENYETEASSPVTFVDALSREVTVDSPKRVAVLLGSFADVWVLAGGEVSATVKDAWTSFDLNLSEDVVNVGSFLEPDLEKLFDAEPDFIIASAGTSSQVELLDVFENSGITTAYFEVSKFEDYLGVLETFTQITGNSDSYKKYGEDVADSIEAVRQRAKKEIDEIKAVEGEAPTVLFIRAAASSVKAKGSKGTVGGEILADLGLINIADSDEGLLEDISLEAIVAADPDYIFVTTQGEDTEAALANVAELFSSNPAWSELTAVKSGRYFEIEKELYNSKPNARWGEAYEKLANYIFGE
ncbi:MAG: ABC transporter substrate-binding protein [Lachnospiraceae bacterium]|nr:ABC transporter substrate-binding protein [Lachnospiraceae bacterium]